MGSLWSRPTVEPTLDGLGFQTDIERDFSLWEALEKLEQLLRASANNYRPSVIPQALVAAYYLGAYPEQLTILYEKWVVEECTPWPVENPTAESVGKFNLSEFYGDQSYEERFFEYFRDCFTEEPDSVRIMKDHREMLWPRFVRNDFAPLVQLSAAIESNSDMVFSLALAMACSDPPGTVEEPSSKTDPQLSELDGAYMATKLRLMAKAALESQAYETVVPVHSCAEIFLSPKGNPFTFNVSIALLDSLEKFIHDDSHSFTRLPTVDNSDALFSEDWKLITYTRSRMVLEKLAL